MTISESAATSTRTLADCSQTTAVDALNRGFGGYMVPFVLTPAQFESRFRGENLDPYASWIEFSNDDAVAIVLVARRGWVSRVAALGVAPEMRKTGIGSAMIERAIAQASDRADARLTLEVIEGNESAIKLYQRAGFVKARRLHGFSMDAGPRVAGSTMPPLIEIDPALGARRAGMFRDEDLPWQLQLPTLAAMVRPTRCFTNDLSSVVGWFDSSETKVRLRALALHPRMASKDAIQFTAAMCEMFANRTIVAPPIFPDDFREAFFSVAGWKMGDIAQFEMSWR